MLETTERTTAKHDLLGASAVYDVRALCERWGASEQQVLALTAPGTDVMHVDHCLPCGDEVRPIWSSDMVAAAESLMPELEQRDPAAALKRFEYVMQWADRVFPMTELPEGLEPMLSEHALGGAWDARFEFVHDQLEHTRPQG